jgi:hypothetical protein
MAKKNVADPFFAKFISGGLILRLLVVLGALLVGLIACLLGLGIAGTRIDWVAHGIAFALLAIAFSAAHVVESTPVDPQFVLARLMATTAFRIGIPAAGLILFDRVLRPGFLSGTLVFVLVGFSIGLITGLILSVGQLSQKSG